MSERKKKMFRPKVGRRCTYGKGKKRCENGTMAGYRGMPLELRKKSTEDIIMMMIILLIIIPIMIIINLYFQNCKHCLV